METRTHPQYRVPAISAILAVAAAVLLCAAILDIQDWWKPLVGIGSEAPRSTAAAAACRNCGVVESVRSMNKAEIGSSHVALRGFGDDVMSVLVLAMSALAGNRINPRAEAAAMHEITVRFEDGTIRVFRIAGGPGWQSGDRVKVIQGTIYAAG